MIDYLSSIRQMIMTCDVCEEESKFYGIWSECIAEAKEEGWEIYQNEVREYKHICPICAMDGMTPEKKTDVVFPPMET